MKRFVLLVSLFGLGLLLLDCPNPTSSPSPSYAVTYNANGSTGGSVPIDSNDYEQGAKVTVLANNGNLVRTGFAFIGWNTKVDGSGTSYTPGATFSMGTAKVSLSAVWTANPTYTVMYSRNNATGGSVPTDSTNYLLGATVTVLGNTGTLVKPGYAFIGWNTQANGGGGTYNQSQTFTMGASNVTLYAVWTQNQTYAVMYNPNGATGGSVPADSTNYLLGATVTVLGNTGTLMKAGYAFAGWNTQANGGGGTYNQSQTFTMGASNMTLYAVWIPTYIVIYNANGSSSGSVPIDSANYLLGATVTVLGNTGTLAKTGYAFAGWNTQANGGGGPYTLSQTFTMGTASVTLYAMWTQNPTYTVTYNANGATGGSVPADSTNYLLGATVTVLGNAGTLVKTGYAFAGWNTQPNGGGVTYTQSQTFSMGAASVTLYAVWTQDPTYTVTYNANGSSSGSVPTDSTNYLQGQMVTVLGNIGNLVKTGYSFNGWNTRADGTGTNYVAGTPFSMGTANVSLFAVWWHW